MEVDTGVRGGVTTREAIGWNWNARIRNGAGPVRDWQSFSMKHFDDRATRHQPRLSASPSLRALQALVGSPPPLWAVDLACQDRRPGKITVRPSLFSQ